MIIIQKQTQKSIGTWQIFSIFCATTKTKKKQLLGCALISGLGGFLCFEVVSTEPQFTSNESSWYIADPMFISCVAGVVSLVVAMAFMIIFDQTADTLLYCFVYEKQSGSGGRYAPDSLAALLANTKE